MAADFSDFDPNASYNADNGSDFMGFKSRNNACNCLECDQRRALVAAGHLRAAATCKCGYCEPVEISAYDTVLGELDRLGQIINDLQSDYARDMSNERNASMFLIERIDDLRMTIRVLSEMINT